MELDKSYIGHAFPPFTTTVEAGRMRLFCKALGIDDAIYTDAAAARAAGYRDLVAPPTFPTAISFDNPDTYGTLDLLNVDIGYVLHGEQEFEYFAPICAGDEITVNSRISDIYDKKDGALWFIVTDSEMTNQAGEKVCAARSVTVVRNPDAGG